MRSVIWLLKKRHYLYVAGLLFGAAALLTNGLSDHRTSAQAVNSIYVTPASGTHTVGDNITLSVRVNTADSVNAVGANLTYTTNLQYVSIDATGSAFGIDASSSGGSGSVSISRATITPVSGDQLVAKVTFKVLSAGSGTIGMQNSSEALSASTNQNVITARNGGSYTLQAPTTPPATPPATPPSTPPAKTTPPPAATNKTTTNKSATSIAPQGNPTTTPLPGGSAVELEAPATVETTPDPNKEVTKVEYLLNGKLVKTDDQPPYSHDLNTVNMRNGTYELETKTYYKNGTTDMSKASLTVDNSFGLTQLWLQLRHFAWLVIILLIIAGELVYLKLFRNRSKFDGGGPDSSDTMTTTGHGTVVVGGSSTGVTIQPTVTPPVGSGSAGTPQGGK